MDDPHWRRDRVTRLAVVSALEAAAVSAGVPELESVRSRLQETRSTILITALEHDLEASIELEAGAARRHYDAKRERFTTPERVSTRLILVHVDPQASPSEVVATEVRLRQIRQEFLDGAPFGALARRHSEAENAARGGAVAASARGTLLPEFEEVAWSLEPGQVSDVVHLPDGLALILTERRFPIREWQFEEVRDTIIRRLEREELQLRRRQILAEASARWPLAIDWQRVADPATTDQEPLLWVADKSFNLTDLGLNHRPPRLGEAVESAVEVQWLRLWAEDQGYGERPDVVARFAHQRRTLLAAVELDRRVSARLPEPPEAELQALYSSSTATLVEPERRSFLAVVVPGEAMRMRPALAAARKIEQEWQRTGEVPAGCRVERWGPLRQVDLSAATSPLLAKAAFALAEDRTSEPILLERYGMGSARFQPDGYVVLRVAHVEPAQVPPLDEVRDRLTRRLLAEQVAAARAQLQVELRGALELEIDPRALAGCELTR